MGYLPVILLGLFILIIITLPFTVLVHELGHAFALLILTKQGATVFIGSYGDHKHSFKVSVSKLDIWIRYNPLKWKGGLCIAKAKKISPLKTFIYIFCGPLSSLSAALLLFLYLYQNGVQSALDFICAFAVFLNGFVFLVNLFPFRISAAVGKIFYSDGYWLLHLKKLTNGTELFREGCRLFNDKVYEKAAKLFTEAIDNGYKNEDSYRLTYLTYLILQQYETALQFLKKLERKYGLNDNDYYNYGYLGFVVETKTDQDIYFQKSLALNPENTDTLNAIGYRLNQKKAFLEALPYFEKAIQINPNHSYAYNNRGHVKLETGLLEEGLADILYSISLDNQNAYAYRNQGIYYLKKNEKEQAIQLFKQAKQIDENTELVEDLMKLAYLKVD